VVSPQRYDERMPMAHLRHISIFHLIAAGGCTVETASGSRREVKGRRPAADAVCGSSTSSWTAMPPDMAFASDIVRPGADRGHMDGEPRRRRRRDPDGRAASSSRPNFFSRRCFAPLPELLVERTDEDRIGALIASTVREILALVDAARPGTQMMLGRLMELPVRRGAAASRHPASRPAAKDGSPRSTIRWWRARSCGCTPTRHDAGRRMISRAKQARRARCLPNGSTHCSAGRRSTM
jgi:hypothetical protein